MRFAAGILILSAGILLAMAPKAVKERPDKSREEEMKMSEKIKKSESEWKKILTPEQYHVMREKGTERPFTGEYVHNKKRGVYRCAGCGAELFSSDTKFDSGTGWPSFWAPAKSGGVAEESDGSHFMQRTEVHCPVCGAHLGHVFDDGPQPTGLRYCINSVSLKFSEAKAKEESARTKAGKNLETAVFAAGCFWGVEETFRTLKGVQSTRVGYTGGSKDKPTYEQVCTGRTGHAEAVEVVYDPKEISYEKLLSVFWENHNPTTLNRQGPDHGTQYRSAIFFTTPEQEAAARKSRTDLEKSGKWKNSIVTEIAPASNFWPAEDYHQQYLKKRGLKFCHL